MADSGLRCLGAGCTGLRQGLLGPESDCACFAPFYLLRANGSRGRQALGRGGAFLGPQGAFLCGLFSLLAGDWPTMRLRVVVGALFVPLSAVLCTRALTRGKGASAVIAAQGSATATDCPSAYRLPSAGIAACWYLTDFSVGGCNGSRCAYMNATRAPWLT